MNPSDFDIGVLNDLTTKSYTIFWVLAISGLVSIILARIISSTYINGLFQYSNNYNQQLFSLNSLSSPLLTFNYLIALTLSIYTYLDAKGQDNIESTTLYTLLSIAIFYIVKTGIQYLLANLFLRKELFEIKNAFRLYQIVGLVLLPLCIISLYQSSAIKLYSSVLLAIILFASLFVFWYFSMKDSIHYKISLFYIFLYLCTLEILPLLLIAKYLLQ